MQKVTSRNPATGEILVEHDVYDTAQLKTTLARARNAQAQWARLSFGERSRYLLRAKAYIFENIDQIAKSISLNNGKPLVEALTEVVPMIQTIDLAVKRAEKILAPKKVAVGLALPTKRAHIQFRPMGIIGIISPWNYPLSTPLAEIILGLAAGNAIIIKPSDVTGLVNDEIQRIIDAMKLPDGLFTMLHGQGDVGATLVKSGVDRIIVTGSVGTGKKVMEAASQNLTPVTLELGGKDAMIVLEDADLEIATSAAVIGGFYNAGQTCCSVERLLLHESIASAFLEKFKLKLAKLRTGPSTTFDNDLGPITFEGQKKTYLSQTRQYTESRKNPDYGNANYDGKSNFMNPLVVEGDDNLAFWNDETFGPVIAYQKFRTLEQAIHLNNASPFGLTAMIWTKNNRAALKLAKNLNVGTVVINDAPFTNAAPSLPWGGVRESGFGWVHGELGLKEMSHAQVVIYDIAGQQKQFWWFPHSKAQYDFFKNYVIVFNGTGIMTRLKAFIALIKNLSAMGPRL